MDHILTYTESDSSQ